MDGLPSGSVMRIYQDRDGFLWFGTWVGVSRFDGQNFVTYSMKDGLVRTLCRECIRCSISV